MEVVTPIRIPSTPKSRNVNSIALYQLRKLIQEHFPHNHPLPDLFYDPYEGIVKINDNYIEFRKKAFCSCWTPNKDENMLNWFNQKPKIPYTKFAKANINLSKIIKVKISEEEMIDEVRKK